MQLTNSKVNLYRKEDSLQKLFECQMKQSWDQIETHLVTTKLAQCDLEDID